MIPQHFPTGKNYNSYNEYFKKTFGERVQKLSIDAGFTCPNRDGSISTGGCTYCNNEAFNPSYCNPAKSIIQQIEEGIEFHKVRYRRASRYLAYFQTYSNTYGSLDYLKDIYCQAFKHDDVVGLVIGTRPDCIDDNKLDFLAELSKKYYIMIEYGLETTNNTTLERINRGHTYEQCAEAIIKTASLGIHTGTHLIFGLPGETRDEMLERSTLISKLPLETIKFHQLQIVKDTVMARDFAINPHHYNLYTLDEYIDFIIRFIERLNPSFVIERFTGEVPPRFLVNNAWGLLRADQVLVKIIDEMNNRNTWQGKYWQTNL